MPKTPPTPLTLTMRDARARVRAGEPDLAEWLTQWRPSVPASVWPDLAYTALATRNLETVRTVLALAPDDWLSADRKPNRVGGHRMFSLLAPIQDGSIEAQLLPIVLSRAPAQGGESLLFALRQAPETLSAIWTELPPATIAKKGWVRHWLQQDDPAMLRRWLTLAQPIHEVHPLLVEDGIRWMADKPRRLRSLASVWTDLVAAWQPSTPEVLVTVVNQLSNHTEALVPLLHRVRDLRLLLDLPWAQDRLKIAVWADQVAEATAWVAVLPVALTAPVLKKAYMEGAAEEVDQCLTQAEHQPDPHGHLDALAVELAEQSLPQWQGYRQARARQHLLNERPATVLRASRRRS